MTLDEKYSVNLGSIPINYQVKVSKRARRLRVTISQQDVSVTLPQGVHLREAEKFLRANAQWVLAQLERSKKQTPRSVLPADVILVHGVPNKVERIEEITRKLRAKVEVSNGHIKVFIPAGSKQATMDFVRDHLRSSARIEIEDAVVRNAALMGCKPKSVSIRDQRTRWGSCSTRGTLSFNWRLIMAPQAVLDYVVIHELAHMFQPNHSKDFWEVVQKYDPTYMQSRLWLRKNANALRPKV
jgi:predicted metal-dependent hydrolase